MNDRPHNFRKASVSAIADEVLGAVIRKTTDVFISRRAASIAELAGFEDLGTGAAPANWKYPAGSRNMPSSLQIG